ncbi:MAG: hypothetical protein DHS20C18_38650 [Saprospiraceae bacterium]|nr:MAG: hypothetical protein DHS20C18_38650 [Saprospiraceae bacterium]
MLLTILFTCLFSSLSALDASLSYAVFKSPDQPYVEVYLHVAGKTVTFAPVTDSTAQAGIEVLLLFKQGEKVIKVDKYILNSPVTKKWIDFVDLKRYALPEGTYELVVNIRDIRNDENIREYKTELKVKFPEEQVALSDIQLLASYSKAKEENIFVKNGIMMEPLPYNFYGRNTSNISFYSEVYNTDKVLGEDFLVSYSIRKAGKEDEPVIMISHKRQQAAPIVPVLLQMDISRLPSGNYNLVVEVQDRSKGLLSHKKIYFQRSNPYLEIESLELDSTQLQEEFVAKLSHDQLEYSLRALTPIIPTRDMETVNLMLRNDKVEAQRNYLFSYWARRSPTAPEFAYKKYMEVAAAVDKTFRSGFRYGFETDRGFTYLKYGQPSDIQSSETDPTAPPYEIWSYNSVEKTGQNNARFVFYNPSLAAGDFVLLHSDVIGERNNPNWARDLYRDAPNDIEGGNYFDGTEVQDNFNRNAGRLFRDY